MTFCDVFFMFKWRIRIIVFRLLSPFLIIWTSNTLFLIGHTTFLSLFYPFLDIRIPGYPVMEFRIVFTLTSGSSLILLTFFMQTSILPVFMLFKPLPKVFESLGLHPIYLSFSTYLCSISIKIFGFYYRTSLIFYYGLIWT